MNNNWIKTTLGECAIINDRTYRPREQWPFVNYLETGQITDNIISGIHHFDARKDKIPSRARRKVRPGDIVYSTVIANKNNFGIINKVLDNFLVSTAFAVIRGKPYIADTPYIYYFITQKNIRKYFSILAEQSSSVIPALQMRDLEELQILLPPIEQQQSIANILETFDNKIHINQQMNRTLEGIARTLFKSWFIDFDPVRAKMDGHWQPVYSLPGLPADLYDLFPDRFVPSQLDEIPKGWCVRTVGDVASIKGGKQITHAEFVDNGTIPVFGGAGQMGFTNKHNADGYVITVGRVGAYCGEFVSYRGKAWVNNNASQIIPINYISDEWLFLALQELDMETIRKGAAQPFVSNGDIAKMKLLLPDSETLIQFSKMVKPFFTRREINDIESNNLIQMRDTLAPKLLSGEIRVEDLEGVL